MWYIDTVMCAGALVVQGMDPHAGAGCSLVYRDLVGVLQQPRGGQAGDACADDGEAWSGVRPICGFLGVHRIKRERNALRAGSGRR